MRPVVVAVLRVEVAQGPSRRGVTDPEGRNAAVSADLLEADRRGELGALAVDGRDDDDLDVPRGSRRDPHRSEEVFDRDLPAGRRGKVSAKGSGDLGLRERGGNGQDRNSEEREGARAHVRPPPAATSRLPPDYADAAQMFPQRPSRICRAARRPLARAPGTVPLWSRSVGLAGERRECRRGSGQRVRGRGAVDRGVSRTRPRERISGPVVRVPAQEGAPHARRPHPQDRGHVSMARATTLSRGRRSSFSAAVPAAHAVIIEPPRPPRSTRSERESSRVQEREPCRRASSRAAAGSAQSGLAKPEDHPDGVAGSRSSRARGRCDGGSGSTRCPPFARGPPGGRPRAR